MAHPQIITPGNMHAQHVYNWTTKYLARDSGHWASAADNTKRTPRHEYFGIPKNGVSSQHAEAWRYPLVEAYYDPALTAEECLQWNTVTFIHMAGRDGPVPEVKVLGLPFADMRSVTLARVEDSLYSATTLLLPAARAYRYSLLVDGNLILDPLNPRTERLATGEMVSRFFTHRCFEPIVLERWEITLLKRITNHILPFNSREADIFQNNPGSGSIDSLRPQLHLLDYAVGAVNYIDKLLAGEESHHLDTYKACLIQINKVLRMRNPYLEPASMPEDLYVTLYKEMADGIPAGWDASPQTGFDNPKFFLSLLRRHVWTGAFSHPKHGGNAHGRAWLWLKDQFPFDYEAVLEPPYGRSTTYRG